MPYLKTRRGLEWYYELEGEGEILFFIHGWGVNLRIWRQQTKYFSQFYKVLSVDLPGHGKSGWRKISLKDMAQDLNELLEELKIQMLSVVGSSLGGLMALRLFEAVPQKIKRIIFVGAHPKFARSPDYPYGLDLVEIRKLAAQVQTRFPAVIDIFFRSLFTREERETRRFKWIQTFRKTEAPPMSSALIEYLDLLEKEDLRDVLFKIDRPLQFINGTHDHICSLVLVETLRQQLPQARYDFFVQCGHFPFLSKPNEFNRVLERFLNATRHS